VFSFVRSDGKTAIIGEHDYNEIDSTRRGLIEVSNQLSNTMRDLYKANAELARLNEMKNEFLGIAAHDLRTPIGNISSLSGMLLDDVGNLLPEEHVELLLTIRSLSEFMLTMLENLLDITAIESGKVTLSRDRLDLATIVKRAIKLNKILADRKGIGVEILAEASIAVVGDAHKLQQVLDNLISNAIKYSERDTLIQVTVRTAKNEAIVSVIDHGPGLGEDDIAKLFRPFFRARSKATGGEKSTGLGLAIVQRIIQAHNGRVWVESRVGYGSIFSFALPTDNDYLNIPTGDR
jgi:signal transduction histidine kinase